MIQSQIHTVLFDLDGTLSDTAVLTMGALRRLAPEHGLQVPSEETVKFFLGYATPEFMGHMFPDLTPEEAEKLGQLSEKGELDELEHVDDILFDGVLDLLKSLATAGVRMHIASTGSNEHVMAIIDSAGIGEYFETVSCDSSDKTEMISRIIKGSEKSGYALVGDSVKDYAAARENGILSVGVSYGYCSRETSDFDLYIDHPLELLKILEFEK